MADDTTAGAVSPAEPVTTSPKPVEPPAAPGPAPVVVETVAVPTSAPVAEKAPLVAKAVKPKAPAKPAVVKPVAAKPATPSRPLALKAAPRKTRAVASKAATVAMAPVAKPAAAVAPVAVKAPARKAATRPVVAKAPVAVKAPVVTKSAPQKNVAAVPPKVTSNSTGIIPAFSQLKDTIMAKTISPLDFTAAFKTAFAEAQEKAKAAYEKSTVALGEANDFTKGNVEALVESGKLLAAGLQELGSSAVADSKSTFETITADVKELAAVKSPTEFFQLQSTIARRNFDNVVAASSKGSEALLKLVNEAFAPISSRVSLAVDKVSKAA